MFLKKKNEATIKFIKCAPRFDFGNWEFRNQLFTISGSPKTKIHISKTWFAKCCFTIKSVQYLNNNWVHGEEHIYINTNINYNCEQKHVIVKHIALHYNFSTAIYIRTLFHRSWSWVWMYVVNFERLTNNH